jgi:hypothetical protein
MTKDKSEYAALNAEIDRLNFEKIRAYMKLTEWKWGTSEGYELPTVSKIKVMFMSLFHAAMADIRNGRTYSIVASGGFQVVVGDDAEGFLVSVTFNL